MARFARLETPGARRGARGKIGEAGRDAPRRGRLRGVPRRRRIPNPSPPRSRAGHAWVLVWPSDDVPGQWLAHCLDWDVLSHGRTPREAVRMVLEAITIVFESEIAERRDPFARKPAPKKEWTRLEGLFRHGAIESNTEIAKLDAREIEAVATQVFVLVDERKVKTRAAPAAVIQP